MKQIACLLIVFPFLFSCKKDNAKAPTNTDKLTSATWKYDSGGADIDQNGTIDIPLESTSYVQACMLDNTGTFNSNGTGIADEGATKCNVALPQTTPFNWAFTSNETAITITGSGLFGLGGEFKVLELTDSRLGLSKDTTVSGISLGVILYLKH